MIIKRDRYLQKLIDRRHSSYIKIITGIRRCGKSYLLKTLYYNYLLSQGINKSEISEDSGGTKDVFWEIED